MGQMAWHERVKSPSANVIGNFNSTSLLGEAVVETESAGPGILVFTPWTQLLYRNRQAAELIWRLIRTRQDSSKGVLIPTEVTELVDETVRLTQFLSNGDDWSGVQRTRAIEDTNPPILLRGFGIPDPKGVLYSRFLILIDEMKTRQKEIPIYTQQQFHLTNRERTVFQYLAKGWTNKKIAHGLNLAEGTVKKHVKNIMRKTATQTRTGILGKCFNVEL